MTSNSKGGRRSRPSDPTPPSPQRDSDAMEFEGEVVEALPNAWFKVKITNPDLQVLGHISGKMRVHRIRILPGDRVRIEMSSYDLSRGRITYRFKGNTGS